MRSAKGQINEFAVAFIIFLTFALAIINVAFIPVRFLFCQATLSELANTLAHCEKRSDVDALLKRDQSWKTRLAALGVTVTNERSEITATTGDGSAKVTFRPGQPIPKEWLPNDPKAPIYSIAVKTICRIAPAVSGNGGIPGVSGPISIPVSGTCQWENVSPDAKTMKYFIEL